ncbi:PREDICTED: uncharacterized protein LOC107327508 [Acropora digitifera]|uniref:uncharacterized protein LOC107327508 n=1 Tax=Acropora digitifera TaxID=70779 RepID=UPI00077A9182|nr:PREDICTED: uncharacterized protein LOC107327508 [Acropora digitifera]XP_015747741.1 PREDICTED: uncharacterized protein LOC107327508 [Acropora digitifera]
MLLFDQFQEGLSSVSNCELEFLPAVSSTPMRQNASTIDNQVQCSSCERTIKENKELKQEVKVLKFKVTRLSRKMAHNQQQWVKTLQEMQKPSDGSELRPDCATETTVESDDSDTADDLAENSEDDANESHQLDIDDDPNWTPERIDEVYQKLGEDTVNDSQTATPRLDCNGKDEREEPKGIVFLSKLLILFQYCHNCLAPSPETSCTQTGTLITIKTKCSSCHQIFTWESQPFLMGKFPAGNILLSFATLCAGASIKKLLTVFRHMGLLAFSEPTFYYHQRHLLIPTVISFWRKYQSRILESLKGKEVVIAGDGRHDSMGHSAKYGTYTIFCCTVGLIIHIVLVQANQAGSSTNIEFMAFKEAITYLLATGMIIKSFISDRHVSIARWMREECGKKCTKLGKPVINHFFDLWHIGKSKT